MIQGSIWVSDINSQKGVYVLFCTTLGMLVLVEIKVFSFNNTLYITLVYISYDLQKENLPEKEKKVFFNKKKLTYRPSSTFLKIALNKMYGVH